MEMVRAEMANEADYRHAPDGEVLAMARAVLARPITADEEIERAKQTAEKLRQAHWLIFGEPDEAGSRWVKGCMCGFEAHPDDCGYGDSVTVHMMRVAALTALDDLCEGRAS